MASNPMVHAARTEVAEEKTRAAWERVYTQGALAAALPGLPERGGDA